MHTELLEKQKNLYVNFVFILLKIFYLQNFHFFLKIYVKNENRNFSQKKINSDQQKITGFYPTCFSIGESNFLPVLNFFK